MNLKKEIVDGLRLRYADVHPLMFHRSCERAKDETELFDILETMPKDFPMVWRDEIRGWQRTDDLFLSSNFDMG